jgi:hypothetical protein
MRTAYTQLFGGLSTVAILIAEQGGKQDVEKFYLAVLFFFWLRIWQQFVAIFFIKISKTKIKIGPELNLGRWSSIWRFESSYLNIKLARRPARLTRSVSLRLAAAGESRWLEWFGAVSLADVASRCLAARLAGPVWRPALGTYRWLNRILEFGVEWPEGKRAINSRDLLNCSRFYTFKTGLKLSHAIQGLIYHDAIVGCGAGLSRR